MIRRCLTLALCLVLHAAVHAATVIDDGISLSSSPNLTDYGFTVIQDVPLSDLTGVSMRFAPAAAPNYSLTGLQTLIDEGSDWYFVRAGDIFTSSTIAAGNFPRIMGVKPGSGGVGELNTVTFSPLLDFANGLEPGPNDFYLAVATTGRGAQSLFDRNVFGWIKVRIDPFFPPIGGLLVAEDDALAFGSQGIIVGTRIAVPEPATFAMAAIGAICLTAIGLCNRRQSSAPEQFQRELVELSVGSRRETVG